MNEVEFRNWLSKRAVSKKMQSDLVSRIKRIEREIHQCDIDEQYRTDRCELLMKLFSNMGINMEMQKISTANFPIGKYSMNTFRYALKQYISFSDEVFQSSFKVQIQTLSNQH